MRDFNLAEPIRRFLQAEDGATAIEYALIASGVSIGILGVVTNLGEQIQSVFYEKLNNIFK